MSTLRHELPDDVDPLDEVCKGMMYASLAITDDNEATLEKVGKANPWHIEALRLITGSDDQAHQPLTTILEEDMNGMKLLCNIDISGITKGGHFLDTQGYIAYNHDSIVLSYRCTTSAFDWLTNFNTTTSQWEIEEDLAQGFSGYCSGLEGFGCCGGEYKPRVHTGFYNNFLASLPLIKQHMEPLLHKYAPPKTVYVVGHSLGAGIATLAGCYFMMEFDWDDLPHTLINVTAGSPRAVCESMKTVMDQRRAKLGIRNARLYRVVKGQDVVTRVPPHAFGFRHLIDPVVIPDFGGIQFPKHTAPADADNSNSKTNSNAVDCDTKEVTQDNDAQYAASSNMAQSREIMTSGASYEHMVARIPKALRDHMPDFYLKPLFKARGLRHGTLRTCVSQESSAEEPPVQQLEEKPKDENEKQSAKPPKKRWVPQMFRPRNKAVEPIHW